jgi:prepilin-type N-terminal cleavage/methylation domain-containing protein
MSAKMVLLVKRHKAFTLVELLVVIAIIAVLLSILMPVMGTVRNQARLLMCTANCKQIGSYIALYEIENSGVVPVIFNRFTVNDPTVGNMAAKYVLVSVAFAAYDSLTAKLGSSTTALTQNLSPDKPWTNNPTMLQTYYTKYLPKQYCCPFTRGKPMGSIAGQITPGKITLGGRAITTQTTSGYRDTFSTWRWFYPAGTVWFPNHPLGKPNGIQKYGVLPWNRQQEGTDPSQWLSAAQAIAQPIKWDSSNLRQVQAGTMADATVLYCDQGQYDNYCQQGGNKGIYNYGSHKKSNTGGTNAVFADTHVGWVSGTQIGWP